MYPTTFLFTPARAVLKDESCCLAPARHIWTSPIEFAATTRRPSGLKLALLIGGFVGSLKLKGGSVGSPVVTFHKRTKWSLLAVINRAPSRLNRISDASSLCFSGGGTRPPPPP